MTALQRWLRRIEALHPADIELGLGRVAQVYARLPAAHTPTVVTVAGTNGKGSTVECITRCALALGKRVGTYTSPHLVRFNERMCLNGSPADDDAIVAAFEAVEQARGDLSLTYFEFTTLAALALFRARELDLWVLEVGLGGRLDAVNVVDADVAVITSIGLDHQDWLGPDRESIGLEKAGILRPAAPAICSDPEPPAIIADRAEHLGTPLWQLGEAFDYEQSETTWSWYMAHGTGAQRAPTVRRGRLPIPVGAVLDNLAGAFAALNAIDLLPDESRLGQVLETWSLRGRLQRENIAGSTWWFDVAHNAESAQLLARTLKAHMAREEHRRCVVVLGMLSDKPVVDVVRALSEVATAWLVVDVDGARAMASAELAALVQPLSAAPVERFASVAGGVAVARARADAETCVVVTGSFHTVGPALAWAAT